MLDRALLPGLIATCLVATVAPGAMAQSNYQQMTIGITPVRGDDPAVCDAIYNAFRNQVIALNRFTIIERDDDRMNAVIKEGAFNASGLTADGSGPQIGKLIGAGFLAFLEYDRLTVSYEPPKGKDKTGTYRAKIGATARFVNSETGVALKAFNASGSSSDDSRSVAVQDAIDGLVREMLIATRELFALKASIVERDGKEVVVNLGSRQGVSEGTYFTVQRDKNGVRKPIGKLQITDVGEDRSEARIKEGYWAVKEGDTVTEDPRGGGKLAFGLTYEYVPLSVPVNPNLPAGVTAGNLTVGHLIGLKVAIPELIGDAGGLALGGGYLTTAGPSGFVFDLLGNYRFDLVPEIFALDLQAGPTLANFGQPKANYLGNSGDLSQVSDSNLGSLSFGVTAGLNAVVSLHRNAQLTAGVGYRLLSPINAWSGSQGKNDPDFTAPGAQMIYPSFGLNGVVFQAGLHGVF